VAETLVVASVYRNNQVDYHVAPFPGHFEYFKGMPLWQGGAFLCSYASAHYSR